MDLSLLLEKEEDEDCLDWMNLLIVSRLSFYDNVGSPCGAESDNSSFSTSIGSPRIRDPSAVALAKGGFTSEEWLPPGVILLFSVLSMVFFSSKGDLKGKTAWRLDSSGRRNRKGFWPLRLENQPPLHQQ
ncbi:hypothetical protein, partial [Streptomyces sp. IBSBF 2390]|uniref:hypothetical protein n=1 Tax=Streptomyces sp. IBSBF 2390 TaxID=2903533 RepID=UPI002FDC4076